jgi:hypothetical protein
VGPAALRRSGPPAIPDDSNCWAGARSELVPPYIFSNLKQALALLRPRTKLVPDNLAQLPENEQDAAIVAGQPTVVKHGESRW